MHKSEFTIGKLTFYYIIEEKHVDIFVAGISNAHIRGIMTTKEFQNLYNGLLRIKDKII